MLRFALLVMLTLPAAVHAAEWQWSVAVTEAISNETKDHPRAFLWIPPTCRRVRAVVVGQHNMEEEPILEHPAFRKAMAELDFAEVWISPPLDFWFRFDQGAGEKFDAMMAALAKESGYAELAHAPVAPIGHSAAASFPWNFAAWNPRRTLAALSISGQWPFWPDPGQPDWGARSIDGVPGLVTIGEYEWANDRAADGLKQRARFPRLPLSMLSEAGAGHFDVTDAKVEYLALYLKKAAQYRLTPSDAVDGTTQLRPINPALDGWLAGRWRGDIAPTAAPAQVAEYKGDAAQAFWYFDRQMALETERLGARYRGRKVDLLGYAQDGHVVEQVNGTHQQVTLKWLPLDDGLTFRLTGAFLDTVPAGRPERWTALKAGGAVEHAHGGGPIHIDRICGPVVKLSEDTFAVRFYRMGLDNPKRTPEIWLAATHPGDEQFRRAVQQAVLRIPYRNDAGAEQHITFPAIPDQRHGARTIKLRATSDSGAPVHYYVREGPAEIDGGTLRLTAIPPYALLPVKVTVVAWQWGRTIEPKLRTAEPVVRTFLVR